MVVFSLFILKELFALTVGTGCGRTGPATSCTDHFRKSTDGTHPTILPGKFPCVRTSLFFDGRSSSLPAPRYKAAPHAFAERQGSSTGKAFPHMAASRYDAGTPYRRNANADILAPLLQVRPLGSSHGCARPLHTLPYPFIPFQPPYIGVPTDCPSASQHCPEGYFLQK